MPTVSYPFLPINLGNIDAYVFMMRVKDLQFISYVARRGVNNEEGAIQRVLNKQRLKSIEDYVLQGNMFYTPFFINWVGDEAISLHENSILIPLVASSAQVIDGQHRLEGLKQAANHDDTILEKQVLVILTTGLKTDEAASIFLNINTEQKPVPKSLIFDLFGVVNNDNRDIPQIRATDIANFLNTDTASPYRGMIKFPGYARGEGFIDLSAVVSALKPQLEDNGAFTRYRIQTLENQCALLVNFFTAFRTAYEDHDLWYNRTKNPFLMNAGFLSAIDILSEEVIPKCSELKSFKTDIIISLLKLEDPLLIRSDIKNMDGKTQRKAIKDYLKKSIDKDTPEEDEYIF